MDRIYKQSREKNDGVFENFPFGPTSVNITKVVLDAYRSGVLSKLCNKSGNVHGVVCEVYAAAFWYLDDAFRRGKLGIKEFGGMLQETTKLVTYKPAHLLDLWRKGVASMKTQVGTNVELDEIDNLGTAGHGVNKPMSAAEKKAEEERSKRLSPYAVG